MAALGRFDEAELLTVEFGRISEQLTPHHRVHGVAVACELEEFRGDWDRILELEPGVVERVEANVETPCVRNARSLLLCALAHAHAGDDEGARRFEERARELWMEGHGLVLGGPLLQLALVRGDLDEVARQLDMEARPRRMTWFTSSISTFFDGLGALGRVEQLETLSLSTRGRTPSSSRSRCGRWAARRATPSCSSGPPCSSRGSASTGTRTQTRKLVAQA